MLKVLYVIVAENLSRAFAVAATNPPTGVFVKKFVPAAETLLTNVHADAVSGNAVNICK